MKGDQLYYKALKEVKAKRPRYKIVVELLNRAHDLGNYKATYALATWYLIGQHVKKDPKLAFKYLQLSTQGNLPEAYYDLAVSYEKGIGCKASKKEAFLNYITSALLGYKHSIYEVGRCYYYGIGIKSDKELSQRWLEAAEHWNVD